MIFFGVSNCQWRGSWAGDVVELFQHREDAETFIRECLEDEPGWVDVLSVVEVYLHGPGAAHPCLS